VAGEFSVDDGLGPAALHRVTELLPAGPARIETERRVWLDTWDWSLFKAGLVLEQRAGTEHRLLLSTTDGTALCQAPAPRRTVTDATLPKGPIRDKVVPLLGIRALLPRLQAEGSTALLPVLDDVEKTVARISVDGPFTAAGASTPVSRVRVETLRGYEKEAREVEEQLSGLAGLRPATGSLFAALAKSAKLKPGKHLAKPEPTFSATAPALTAFAQTLRQLEEITRDNVEGTLAELDTEFLHDLRVAVRRARSVLKMAGGVYDEATLARYGSELKWIGDATSLSRDLDVNLLDFGVGLAPSSVSERGRLSATETTSLEPFRALLQRRHRRAHSALNRVLRADRFTALLAGWRVDLAHPKTGGEAAHTPIGTVARTLLDRSWSRVGKRGRAITVDSPADDLHDLRKRCKELRYLLEFFGGLYDKAIYKAFVDELKRLQDNLGNFQDAEAQWFLVRDCAEELRATAPIDTLLAMGRLAHDLRLRQEHEHTVFADTWARFYAKDNRARFAAMVAGA
jgi:CHAD domain-containing protein